MNNNRKAVAWVIVVAAAVVGLFLWPKFTNPARADIKRWRDAGIDCMPSHQRANLHIHPRLTLTVDGAPETVPANTGIARGCMAELHVHEANGTIHTESVRAGKTFTLGQFLTMYRKPYAREGFNVSITVDGAPSAEGEALVLRDRQEIVIAYTSEPVAN